MKNHIETMTLILKRTPRNKIKREYWEIKRIIKSPKSLGLLKKYFPDKNIVTYISYYIYVISEITEQNFEQSLPKNLPVPSKKL